MRRAKLLYRRIFPSHVSWKEAARFFLGCVGLEVRLLSRLRVKGLRQLDDIRVIVGDAREPVVFDVGAHVGQSLYKMRNLFPNCRVHSFEPSPTAFAKLKSEWGETEGVVLNAVALGEREMVSAFNEFEGGGSPANSLLAINRGSPSIVREAPLTEQIQVAVETVDRYCGANEIGRIDWLKVDAQGYDLRVLQGAQAMLSRGAIGVISVEVNLLPMYEGEGTLCQLIDFCAQFGYFVIGFYETNYVGNRLSCCDVCFAKFTD
jgi:FkbM family methyltransferase